MLRLVIAVRFHKSQVGRLFMIAMLHFATLVITTMFAVAAAVALHWLFLKAAFLMILGAGLFVCAVALLRPDSSPLLPFTPLFPADRSSPARRPFTARG